MRKLAVLLLLSSCSFANSTERVIRQTEPKVVKIGIVAERGRGTCSGAFITSSGVVLTCAHCFAQPNIRKVFIKTDANVAYPAALLAIDPSRDLALIVPNSEGPFPYLKLGDEPVRGQKVVAFGSPLGMQGFATIGWVSNLIKNIHTFIFHTASINPCNSGSPLVDLSGHLVGVNEATISYGIFERAEGMNVAISVSTVKEFLKEQTR